MNRTEDYHLHTTVSDGEMAPELLLRRLRDAGVRRLSITDHDSIGAYLPVAAGGSDAVAVGRRLGLEVLTGIEMDCLYQGVELHMLGFELDIAEPALNAHLDRVRGLRDRRTREQIEIVNATFGRPLLDPAKIFIPGRFTVMSPHVIRVLLAAGMFDGHYGTAKKWMKANVKPATEVPKPAAAEAIALIRAAGGRALLAHPGFYMRESGLNLKSLLVELKAAGLSGVEADYPYMYSDGFRDPATGEGINAEAGRLAAELDLGRSFGTDVHTDQDFARFYPAAAGR
ncbi:MAG: PHP domain-containing protein [Planctomycetes bacterium]|nr:PHP domain-containing protein [Planctomycetota bacterium]